MLPGMSKPSTTDCPAPSGAPKRQLTLFDSTCIIVGIIIGAGIYESSPLIARNVAGVAALIGTWILGGALSLVGALCYAELATAYPRSGGDYVYLSRAFGRWIGFLFAWIQLWVVRPGSIGAMAYIFARYAYHLRPFGDESQKPLVFTAYAAGSILVLTIVNLLGVREGKWTQNLLTTVKTLGLMAVAAIGLCFAAPAAAVPAPLPDPANMDFGLALILVLFAYGGWSEMAYVGAEVHDPHKNILRALLLGTVAVAAVYVVVTLAFLHCLGLEGTRNSGAVAAQVLELGLGSWAGSAISVLICISALGAINGQIFTGSRIYYAMGSDHRLFGLLGKWNERLGIPVWSLLIQAVITLATVIGFGLVGKDKVSKSGFEAMVMYTTPVFWGFLFLVGIGLMVLRRRAPEAANPYRVPGYPVVPIMFCASCLYLVYRSLTYAIHFGSYEVFWALGLLAVGVVVSFFNRASAGEKQI